MSSPTSTEASDQDQATSPVAVITGSGAPRVGNRIARRLARRGFRLVIHYRQARESAQQTVNDLAAIHCQAIALAADIRDEGEVDRLFAKTLDRFGRVDLLVTTASVWMPTPLEKVTAAEFCESHAVNTLGTFLCARRAGLIMVAQDTGGLIVTCADWAIARPYPGYVAYMAAKGAIPTLSRALAVELGLLNPRVRVNWLEPGPVMLPEGLSPAQQAQRAQRTLVQQADAPESVAVAIEYLINNPFVTGTGLTVDGGRTIYAGDPSLQTP